ncbi:hypothetical protein AXF42_Ash013051 [Apostasia shenzhenica]|uniref:RNA helicase n=1 Tax=Apostasia shenzhenica TaxID=1088818 RepID=A0A2I0BCX2_9ASPA|nr:hypothetical protein AXF42_Ash013051 [Apostasia shenzhenica]
MLFPIKESKSLPLLPLPFPIDFLTFVHSAFHWSPMSYYRPDRRHGRPAAPLERPLFWLEKPPPIYPSQSLFPHRRPAYAPPSLPSPPGFTVLLFRGASDRSSPSTEVINRLISSCPAVPVEFFVHGDGRVAAKLLFLQWCNVLDALEFFWRRRLEGVHRLTPRLVSKVSVPSDQEELKDRLRDLFSSHIMGLLEGECVQKIETSVRKVSENISKVDKLLSRPQQVPALFRLKEEKKALEMEIELLTGKLEEFRTAMDCLLGHIGGMKSPQLLQEREVDVFMLTEDFDWARIHRIVIRECQRLESGLPIYSFRRKILAGISSNQVVVLSGETGSGKSTQLVQFLADSGLATKGSVICTQPRKIAAISLSRRVSEECIGCYAENFVISYAASACSRSFSSGIIYMTDHCLLQHYMNDTSLSGISYIIVDEAHERSLNSDLLLALLKKKLLQSSDLRLVIMSATADVNKLAEFFYGCCMFKVRGRTFPVDIKYVTDVSDEDPWIALPKQILSNHASYVTDVVKMASIIHRREKDGGILAFLTSQTEVEWACENFNHSSAVALPLHGKLSHEDQIRIFNQYPGKRKVIFSTNLAETSLTIHGIKYVIDSGMVKESRFEPSTGMNVLKVTKISQSSANQRSGRAGRTEPGKCYRLYSKSDYQTMALHEEPEIRKVHLGIALLRILALGMKNIQDFDFVDAPSTEAIDKAVQNLVQLGAIVNKNGFFELTHTGRSLVKLGTEPRLGKIILESFEYGLKKEGLVLASVMANYSSIFCRIGTLDDKHKADCLKVPFCHPDGDLFTLLSVYKEWENESINKNKWCWENSVNAKSMRRCQDTLLELENCLKYELNMICPSYWLWDPHKPNEYDKYLKKIILSSLVENVAMYTGFDQIGYEVALTGQKLQLHPSCSLLVYGEKPSWVVFGEILSTTNQYLVCVTAVDCESLQQIQDPPFNLAKLEERKMIMKIITDVGSNLLRRICGKSNHNLENIVQHFRKKCLDENIHINADFNRREIHLFSAAVTIGKVSSMLNDVLECERRLLKDECIEKSLFVSPGTSPPIALLGSGAEIKHLELDNQYLTVELFHPSAHELNDKELIFMFDKYISGITNFCKYGGSGQERPDSCKWGKVTFLKPELAQEAVAKLNGFEFHGDLLKVLPAVMAGNRHTTSSAIRAKLCWPRRPSKGAAIVECGTEDAESIAKDCFALAIGGRYVNCEVSTKFKNCLFITGIPKDVSEPELYEEFVNATRRKILGVRLFRGDPINCVPSVKCAEALIQEIAPFMPNQRPMKSFKVEVFDPEPRDVMMRATISFDGSLHLEAAKAMEHLHGKVLPGCLSWQKMECRHVFHSSLSCPARVYSVIWKELESLLETFQAQKGIAYTIDRNPNGSFRVKLSAPATKIMADLRNPLEHLMRGKTLTHPSLTPSLMQLLLTRDGITLLKSLEKRTGTYVFYDRQNLNVKIFGSPDKVGAVEEELIQSLQQLHENKPLEIHLRGHNLPPNLMKEVIQSFGADLHGLRSLSPGVDLSLNTRHQILSVRGSNEQKQKVEDEISNTVLSLRCVTLTRPSPPDTSCPICLCELDEPFCLESCSHKFCQSCLINQCESTIRSCEGFPLRCVKEGCQSLFLLADLKALLLGDKLEELFRVSLASFVVTSDGAYRSCPTPDCPGLYRVANSEDDAATSGPFVCGACSAETCRWCHLEYHALISCHRYREYKDSPDFSLLDWRLGKENVKDCPVCHHVIEKFEGCNHVACRCGRHICWVCLRVFSTSDDCYTHLRAYHEF